MTDTAEPRTSGTVTLAHRELADALLAADEATLRRLVG